MNVVIFSAFQFIHSNKHSSMACYLPIYSLQEQKSPKSSLVDWINSFIFFYIVLCHLTSYSKCISLHVKKKSKSLLFNPTRGKVRRGLGEQRVSFPGLPQTGTECSHWHWHFPSKYSLWFSFQSGRCYLGIVLHRFSCQTFKDNVKIFIHRPWVTMLLSWVYCQ